MSVSELLAGYKRAIRGRTLEVLKKVPEDKLNWFPVAGVLSLGQLIHHIGQADMAWGKVLNREWGLEEFLERRRQMDLVEVIGDVESLTDELEGLEITHQALLTWISNQSDEDLETIYDGAGMKATAREIILGLGEHESHHRGQIATYLRLLEVDKPQPWGF
jgi:uncharacterized damage-inducible protein DinB